MTSSSNANLKSYLGLKKNDDCEAKQRRTREERLAGLRKPKDVDSSDLENNQDGCFEGGLDDNSKMSMNCLHDLGIEEEEEVLHSSPRITNVPSHFKFISTRIKQK
jgi:hypothetical protein